MRNVGVLVLRGLAGGALVVAFALLSEVLAPKAFAGLFSSAPSVAVASLAIAVATVWPALAFGALPIRGPRALEASS